MFETDAFLQHLINDTKREIIQWDYVGSWGDGPCSLDFRSTNPVLNELIKDDPFAYNHWCNVLIASVMSGFVYIFRNQSIPSRMTMYLQTDCNSKITRLNISSEQIQDLYEVARNQLTINKCAILNFIDEYNNSHFQTDLISLETDPAHPE